ncbi:hypothetical protein KR084_012750 [Drosophila pseudotakahashii]|nr:hypothetical protein KR084_012750 [Drosophila pseudotakahashii]
MAGFFFGGIAACRRTTHCLGLLRSSYRPLGLHPSLAPLHQRRRRHSTSSGSGESGEKKNPDQVCQGLSQTKEPNQSAGGLETAAAPPDPPKVPGERRPESPYEVRPEVLPIQDQPHRSQPSPPEVKPPNPHTIVCSSDNKYSPGSSGNVLGKNETLGDKVVEYGSEAKDFDAKSESQIFPTSTVIDLIDSPKYHSLSGSESKDEAKMENLFAIESELKSLTASISDLIEQPSQQTFSPIKAELKSMDTTTTQQNSQGVTKSAEFLSEQNTFVTPFQIKSKDSNPAESKEKTHSKKSLSPTESKLRPPSETYNTNGRLDLKVKPSPLHKPETGKASSQTLTRSITPTKNSNAKTSEGGQSSTFNMPGEIKISGFKGNVETLSDRSTEFSQILDKVQEKRLQEANAVKEKQSNRDVIQKWVEHFKLVEKKAAAFESKKLEKVPAPAECKRDKNIYFIETLVKENNIWVPKNRTSSNKISSTSGQNLTATNTPNFNTKLSLPLKIVPKNEAPTEFKQTFKPIPSSELKSNKDTQLDGTSGATKPTEFILSQPTSTRNSKSDVWTSSSADLKNSNAVLTAENSKIVANAQDEPKSQSTEEIVAMFKDENDSEEGRVRELFDTLERFNDKPDSWWTLPELSSATKNSQTDVLATLSSGSDKKGGGTSNQKGHLDNTDSGNKTEDYFTKLGDLDSTIREEEYVKVQKKEDKTDDEYFARLSNLDSTIREEGSDKHNKQSEKSENKDEKSVEQRSFDLAQKVSSFVKSAGESGNRTDVTQKSKRMDKIDSKDKSKVETTSELTPSDLYDPIAPEISSPAPLEAGKAELEEAEESTPSLEAPEVKPKKEETNVKETKVKETKVKAPTAVDEAKIKVNEKAPVQEKQLNKAKPQLDDGELSLKLLDKVSAEMPPTAAAPPPAKPHAEKSLIQHLFDKILGRGKSNESKRRMSSYTGRRHLSTSSKFSLSMRTLTLDGHGKTKVIKSRSGSRTFGKSSSKILTEAHEEKPDLLAEPLVMNRLQQPVLEPPTFELFAKNDDTEIKGGSPECSSPKKSPRELLREKQQTRQIKILGGSEECAKKMKRLKELTKEKDDGDDCGSRHFSASVSRFFRQLWFSIIPEAANNSSKVK